LPASVAAAPAIPAATNAGLLELESVFMCNLTYLREFPTYTTRHVDHCDFKDLTSDDTNSSPD